MSDIDWSSATTHRYDDRQTIFLDGDERRLFYRVEAGTVCLYRTLPDGRRHVFDFALPQDIIGIGAEFEHTLSAQAIGATRLKSLPLKPLHELAFVNPKVALELYRAMSAELESTRDLLVMLGQHDSTERVANFILTLSRRMNGNDASVLTLPMKRLDIADLLGIEIETVSRALAKLCHAQAIELRELSKIQIKDMTVLRQLAGLAGDESRPGAGGKLG